MRKPFVLHPVLIALFPILFLYAHNISQMRLNQLLIPLAVSLGLAFLLWGLCGFLLKDRIRAGLAASIFVFVFFTYGHFYSQLEKWDRLVPGHGYLIPGVLLAFGYGVYFIRQARSDFKTPTRVLNIAAAVMVAINAITIIPYEIKRAQVSTSQTTEKGSAARDSLGNMPDIYLIILDEYANPDTMKEHYDYDNSQFIKSLGNKGFLIVNGSTSHYDWTPRAIASILNMEHIPDAEADEAVFEKIANNKVVDYLRSVGYSYTYFGEWYEVGRYEINADRYFNFYQTGDYGALTAEFSTLLWDTTMLRPFHNYLIGDRYEGYFREGLIRTLDRLKSVPDTEGPKFVYAHIMSPHAPFVFGPGGERIAPANFYNFDDKQFYLGQYIFISREIDRVIEEILNRSATQPIIVIQSDHGPRWLPGWEKILNAYLLPGDGKKLRDGSVSPVDTFRIIFAHYFNGVHEPVPTERPKPYSRSSLMPNSYPAVGLGDGPGYGAIDAFMFTAGGQGGANHVP